MQKKPTAETTPPALDQTECNCLALRQATRHVSQIYDKHLAPSGLRGSQYSILSKLNRLGPLSINELAKAMVMDRTTLGRAIRPLERDKLLTIAPGDDARVKKTQADVDRRNPLQGRASEMAGGAEGVRIGLRSARCRGPSRCAPARGGGNLIVSILPGQY